MASRVPSDDESAGESSLSDWTKSAQDSAAPPPPAASANVFTPGTMLAGRYRVVALLGQGGMGEVYRADDTKLGQAVALKFMRGALSPEVRERLYAEVRIGRQVSHPSVCRLYDIVEVDGHTFLAMEYVDGEDLASLLARIGHLPAGKALDVARDLCAGLAAVHEKGVVHRDLKPANVMIDGRGRARITDFGLAIGLETPGAHGFAGTPSYMAPEQLAGAEVTSRSDLYALGLVLYEMLTGRRFFEAKTLEELGAQHRESKAPKLSSVARELSPAAERVIIQCLEESPQARPASARSILALLPGGTDPLEAAMAAGETPSPEMVAAAGKVGDVAPATAWAGLIAILLGLVTLAALYDRFGLLQAAALPKSPEILEERARAILRRLPPGPAPADSAFSFEWNRPYMLHVIRQGLWRPGVAEDRPPAPFLFFYRESPRKLVAANRDAMVTRTDPPPDVSGMRDVVLDPRGHLLSFLAVPPQREASPGPWPEPDWTVLLQEAGLDPNVLRAADPQWSAPVDSDRKVAWEGVSPDHPDIPLRIEAAAHHGRPVWFSVLPPWAPTDRMIELSKPVGQTPVSQVAVAVFALAMPIGGILLARRNLRLGRGDRKGAFGVALFVFIVFSLARLFRADHVSALDQELWILIKVLAYPAFWAAQLWLLYVALEPYARRRWPHMLISWKRLLGGNLRDPLVGRDVLLGGVVGIANALLFMTTVNAYGWLGLMPPELDPYVKPDTLAALRHVGFRIFVNQFGAVLYAMVFLFILVLLRLLLRNTWLAALVWGLLIAVPFQGGHPAIEWTGAGLRAVSFLLVLTRGGLLALTTSLFVAFVLFETPLTLDFSAWYSTRAVPIILVLVGLALYGFRTSLGGKPLFGRSLLDD